MKVTASAGARRSDRLVGALAAGGGDELAPEDGLAGRGMRSNLMIMSVLELPTTRIGSCAHG